MESTRSSSASVANNEAELFVTDCWDDARYLLMRTLRLAVTLLSEVGWLWSFLMFVRAAWWGFAQTFIFTRHEFPQYYSSQGGGFFMDNAVNHPGASMLGFAVLFAVCFMTTYGAGMPYRFNSKKPGLHARRCWRCRIAIPDAIRCSNCNAWRIVPRVVSLVLLVLSGVVSAVFVVHDFALLFLTGNALGGKR